MRRLPLTGQAAATVITLKAHAMRSHQYVNTNTRNQYQYHRHRQWVQRHQNQSEQSPLLASVNQPLSVANNNTLNNVNTAATPQAHRIG